LGKGSPLPDSGLKGDPLQGAHSLVYINNHTWDTQPNSNLPETPATLAPTMIHELGHALGIYVGAPAFSQQLGSGGSAQFDYNDRIPYTETTSEALQGKLYFYGKKAMEVFGGPVPMAHGSDQESLHFGVRNGLMTHTQITNYPMFMEVELAALADIGYTIDLRNFFGTSLYNDESTAKILTNSQGFFASKGLDTGGAWLGYIEGKPNTSLYGVGLHLYGSNYDVTQQADLLADGAGAAGIRVDGFENAVTIPQGVRVTGNGVQGTGVLVSFGSDHVLTSRGVISATGPLGIGARFDFGAPYVNEELRSYGTYRTNPEDADGSEKGYIGGPLVESFNLSGMLLGGPSSAEGQYLSGEFVNFGTRPIAMYIGPGAHVKTVNIMSGSFIYGDIISRWDPARYALSGAAYMTDLTFGRQMDGQGAALPNSSDTSFSLRYRGNILGPSSIDVALVGGSLDYAGTMEIHSFSMSDKTRLLTEFAGGKPTVIAAEQMVDMAAQSSIGFSPSPFSYGRTLATGKNPVLSFAKAAPGSPPDLLPSAGSFSIGAFDYTWNDLSWDAGQNAVMVNTTHAAFNHQRGGTDARNATLPIIMRTPGLNAVNARMVRRFVGTSPHTSPLGAPATHTPWSQGPLFAGPPSGTFPAFSAAKTGDTSVQGLSLRDGGWEVEADRSDVWVAPFYSFLDHKGGRDYTIRGAGLTFGVDHSFEDKFYLGMALSFDYPRYKSKHADVDARGTTGIFYGGLTLPWDLEMGFNGSLGSMHFEQWRNVGQSNYNNSYSAQTLGFGLGFGRRFQFLEDCVLRPFADWNYFHVNRHSYVERADIYGLRHESSRNNIHRIQVGLEGAWAVEKGSLGVKVYWSGLRGDTLDTASTSFVMDPDGNRFTAPLDRQDENSLGLAFNAGVKLGSSTELRFEYSLLAGKNTTAHQGMLGLRHAF
jgi:hypothetical protein